MLRQRDRELDAPLLGRTAAVVRDRRYVPDGDDPKPHRCERLNGRFASAARPLHPDVDPPQSEIHGFAAAVLRRHRGRERSGLLRALEARLPRGAPRQRVAAHIGDGDQQVVEGRGDVGDALGVHYLLGALGAGRLRWSWGSHLLLGHFLLAGDGAPGTLLGPRIGMGPLAPARQPPPMPDSPVAPDIHQPLDVHGHLGPERALDLNRSFDHLPQPRHLSIGEVAHARVRIPPGFAENPAAGGATDTKDVGEGDLHPLLAREIDAGDTCHDQPCRCLCLGLRLQMMRTTPCLLMTLQCSQIGLTLERTFTCFSRPGLGLAWQYRSAPKPTQAKYRQVIAWATTYRQVLAGGYPTTLNSTRLHPPRVFR